MAFIIKTMVRLRALDNNDLDLLCALENDRFPEPQSDSTHPDYVFTRYQGETSAPYPPFEYLDGLIFDPQAENAKIPLTAQFWQD